MDAFRWHTVPSASVFMMNWTWGRNGNPGAGFAGVYAMEHCFSDGQTARLPDPCVLGAFLVSGWYVGGNAAAPTKKEEMTPFQLDGIDGCRLMRHWVQQYHRKWNSHVATP